MLISTHGVSPQGPGERSPPELQGPDGLGLVPQPGDQGPVSVQLLTQLLHAFEESLPLVESELGLGECCVQGFFASGEQIN